MILVLAAAASVLAAPPEAVAAAKAIASPIPAAKMSAWPAPAGGPPLNMTMPTAVDRRFGPDATASVGFLCGLEPAPRDNTGAGSTFGPVGTFLGGKLSYTFR